MFTSIVSGAQRILDFSRHTRVGRLLSISSGAIYGNQIRHNRELSEDWEGEAVNSLKVESAYIEAKRASEMLCTLYQSQFDVDVSIARCFTFIGPYLPLDANYAIGNFIEDAMNGRTLTIKGTGKEKRSYLYISDLIVWLWSLLVNGKHGTAINVGSDHPVSIYDLAKEVEKVLGGKGVILQNIPPKKPTVAHYIPSVERAKTEYGLINSVPLSEAIRRTAIWNGWSPAV